jgi:hypothetical protein
MKGNTMNTATISAPFDSGRVARVLEPSGLVVEHDTFPDDGGSSLWEIDMENADSPYRVVLEWRDEARGWGIYTAEPSGGTHTLAGAREFATNILRAADLADELNRPDPDMIVELSAGSVNTGYANLVYFDCSLPGRPDGFFSLQPDERIGKHQPGDVWGRVGAKLDFIGKFDFIRWGERDGRKVAMLKHRD